MKSPLKISALVLALAGLTYTAKAQTAPTSTTTSNGVRLSVGVETGIPTGKLNDTHGWNLGGSVQADIPVAEQLFVTVNAGYNNIFGKTVGPVDFTNIQLLPVKGGLKFFPASNFYIQGEAGAGFALNKKDVGFDKSAAFIWAPQVGIQFPVGNKSYLDAGIRYEASTKFNSAFSDSKVNFLGLRLAYAFDTK